MRSRPSGEPGTPPPLRYALSGPESAGDGATVAVLLHGRGSDGRDLQGLRPHLPADWIVVTPQAPHPGLPWGYGPGWAWYRYLGGASVDEGSLEVSLAALDRFLAGLAGTVGVEPGVVVLGGFSQGGTSSMVYAATRPRAVDAVLNFSGFLADSPLLAPPALAEWTTPLFWGHGTGDPNIPHALAQEGRRRLLDAGVPLAARDYPIGHWIDPAEIADAVREVEAALRSQRSGRAPA